MQSSEMNNYERPVPQPPPKQVLTREWTKYENELKTYNSLVIEINSINKKNKDNFKPSKSQPNYKAMPLPKRPTEPTTAKYVVSDSGGPITSGYINNVGQFVLHNKAEAEKYAKNKTPKQATPIGGIMSTWGNTHSRR